MIRLFISHASADAAFVADLVKLLRAALELPPSDVRCTSVDGYRLPGGVNVEQQLRQELIEADECIGILSAHGWRSAYVLFELGARWGTGKRLVPLLMPGASIEDVQGPLSNYHILNGGNPAELHQLIAELGRALSIKVQGAVSYQHALDRVLGHAHLQTVRPIESASSDNSHQQSAKSDSAAIADGVGGDTEAPQLMGFAIPFPEADVKTGPANVELHAHLTDNLAGNAGAGYSSSPTQVRFRSPSGRQERTTMFVPEQHLEKGDRLNGHYRSVVTLPRFAEGGVWRVDYFLLVDQCGNARTLHAPELEARGFPTTITVRS